MAALPNMLLPHLIPACSTGVDKQTGTPCFCLDFGAARQLVKQLETRLECDLSGALALIQAGLANQPPKYDMLQQVHLANEMQYRGVVNGFPKLARQSKSQVGRVSWGHRAPAMPGLSCQDSRHTTKPGPAGHAICGLVVAYSMSADRWHIPLRRLDELQ